MNNFIKYKNKYLELKGGTYSNNILNYGIYGSKYTEIEYNKLLQDKQDKFPFFCPKNKPYLCNLLTPNYGLCKEKLLDCKTYNGENTYLKYDLSINNFDSEYVKIKKEERIRALEFGKTFSYNLYDFHDKDCSKLIIKTQKEYKFRDNIPLKFKIMTYNCWWSLKVTGDSVIDKFHRDFFKIRIHEIAKIINESNTDIVCLQEIGIPTFEILLPLLKDNYPYHYKTPFNSDIDDLETICFSKYKATRFILFSVQGNLHYNNSMLMVEYNNLIIFNVYLQAGTRNSPGQKDLWFNYSRCRYNEYIAIGKFIKDNNISKPITVLGDFNTNLNGRITQWPELKAFRELKLQDAWLTKYNNESGYTEDTNINLMRWNVKFEEKIYRIDGIFYTKDKFITNKINILGDQPININKELQEQFYKYRIQNIDNKDELIRTNNGELQLWPSDHFAVIAELEFVS